MFRQLTFRDKKDSTLYGHKNELSLSESKNGSILAVGLDKVKQRDETYTLLMNEGHS